MRHGVKKNAQLKDVSWAEERAENIYQREKHLESKGEENRNNTVQQNGCECNVIHYLKQREKNK